MWGGERRIVRHRSHDATHHVDAPAAAAAAAAAAAILSATRKDCGKEERPERNEAHSLIVRLFKQQFVSLGVCGLMRRSRLLVCSV